MWGTPNCLATRSVVASAPAALGRTSIPASSAGATKVRFMRISPRRRGTGPACSPKDFLERYTSVYAPPKAPESRQPRAEQRGEAMNATGRAGAAAAMRAETVAPLLVVDDVTLQYKTVDHLVTATWKVGFAVHAADRYVLLGPSGCGKTTILKAIAGFMAPVAGTITLAGRTIERPGPDRMMVFQEFDQLLPWR